MTDPLHPNGECTCFGEGECEWCRSVDEGVGSIATSKLSDLATGFILRARPVIVLHNTTTDSTVKLKLKRGLFRHELSVDEDGRERVIRKSFSAIILMTRALKEAAKYVREGYLEI